jgi:DNA-binding transcriptional ArsR family regulator
MIGIRQPPLSRPLGILCEEKLVETRREGKQIYYSLASKEATAVMQLLYELYCPKSQEAMMAIDWSHFTPWPSRAGGVLIGLAAACVRTGSWPRPPPAGTAC